MLSSFNVNLTSASVCIKKICDSLRCSRCDNFDGARMRYSCGHTACVDCVISEENCSVCFIPSLSSSSPLLDDVLTKTINVASNLLQTFQDTFHMDVSKQSKMAEQLRVEKELFPRCIQARAKYSNKNKSFNISSSKEKENQLSQIPGEQIWGAVDEKFNRRIKYVQQWLSKNDKDTKREPLADLKGNQQSITNNTKSTKSTTNKGKKQTNKDTRKRQNIKSNKTSKNFKKEHFQKISNVSNITNYENKRVDSKSIKISSPSVVAWEDHNEKEESGIEIDEETIVIEDSQSTNHIVDKDKEAWLAVLEANKNDSACFIEAENSYNSDAIFNQPMHTKATQNEIKNNAISITINGTQIDTSASHNITVTIKNNTVTAQITISNNEVKKKITAEHSVSIQTDITDINKISDSINGMDNEDMILENIDNAPKQSQDLFSEEDDIATNVNSILSPNLDSKLNENIQPRRKVGLTISESDSDGDVDLQKVLEVTALVHRSCNESDYEILAVVDDINGHKSRKRPAPRGLTPDSSNSSEKENFDPNKAKKRKPQKKNKKY